MEIKRIKDISDEEIKKITDEFFEEFVETLVRRISRSILGSRPIAECDKLGDNNVV